MRCGASSIEWGLPVACTLLVAVLTGPACSEGGGESAPAEPSGDVADPDPPDGRAEETPDAEADGGGPEACENPPDCDAGERPVGCERCVSELNRICESDRDCRPSETCEDFAEASVCMFEPGPRESCPGSDGCESGSEGPLMAAAASRVVTPQGFERPKPAGVDGDNYMNFSATNAPEEKWHDCGRDGLCPGDEGYDGPDEGEDDGVPQGMWLAGFRHGRPAQYCPEERVGCPAVDCCTSKFAHDDLKVQVVVLRRGDTTVAFAVVDTVGWFQTDVGEVRRRLPDELGVDLLVMAATHNHEAPDTAGQWGPGGELPQRTGRNPRFIDKIYRQTVDGVESAVENLQPARAEVAVVDDEAGIEGLAMDDSRPPYIFDDNIPVVRLTARESGDPIATMLSMGNHPEVLWNDNPFITADYPHYVRKYVREGLDAVRDDSGQVVEPELEGFGGVTVFFAGALGGLINPGDGGARTYAGEQPSEDDSFEAADAVGQEVARRVLTADEEGQFEEVENPNLSFAHQKFLAPLRNSQFQLAAFELGIFRRDVYNAAEVGLQSFEPGPPQILSEVSAVRLGDVTWFTAPGEAFPESLVGGFPGKPTVQDPVVGDVREENTRAQCDEEGLPVSNGDASKPCIVAPDQENPPDWENAPDPPYLYEMVPGDHPFFVGLGGDFVGYLVPKYDFEIGSFAEQAEGSHYEETVSVGKTVTQKWQENLGEILRALPE